MRKILIATMVMTAFLSACKKDKATDTPKENFIKATFSTSSGVINFTQLKAQLVNNTGFYGLVILAQEAGSSVNFIDFGVSSVEPLTTKTYNENSDDNNAIVNYEKGDIHYGTPLNNSNPNEVILTITSISATSADGTFKGSLFLDDDPTKEKITVTNGSFHVTF